MISLLELKKKLDRMAEITTILEAHEFGVGVVGKHPIFSEEKFIENLKSELKMLGSEYLETVTFGED